MLTISVSTISTSAPLTTSTPKTPTTASPTTQSTAPPTSSTSASLKTPAPTPPPTSPLATSMHSVSRNGNRRMHEEDDAPAGDDRKRSTEGPKRLDGKSA